MSYVFISHSHHDAHFVGVLCNALRREGIHPWTYVGQNADAQWRPNISDRIREAAATIVCWSANSRDSKIVRAEADLATECGTLVQVLLDGQKPPLPFNEVMAEDLHNTNFADEAWKLLLSSVQQKLLAKNGRRSITRPKAKDWVAWCVNQRKAELGALADYAVSQGLVFLYGEQSWTETHLRALQSVKLPGKIEQVQTDALTFEQMLVYNESKDIAFPRRLLEMNTLFAATANEFAKAIDYDPSQCPEWVTYETLANPREFVELYFWHPIEIRGQAKSLSRLERASDCFEFFFAFLHKLLNGTPHADAKYVVVWPIQLLDKLLSDPHAHERSGGGELLRDPNTFADQIMHGMNALVQHTLAGRVGMIIETHRFPCHGVERVARNCVLMPPTLSTDEIRSICLDRFGKTALTWDMESLRACSAGIVRWLDLILNYYEYVESEGGNESVSLPGAMAYIEAFLESPNALKQATGETPPDWLLIEMATIAEGCRRWVPEFRAIASIFRAGFAGDPPSQQWSETFNGPITRELLSLEASGSEPLDRWKVFSTYRYVQFGQLAGIPFALMRNANAPVGVLK